MKNKTTGIYKIVNKINNKIYIGQSVWIERRFSSHKHDIKKDFNHHLYNAFRKYELSSFEFIVLEKIENVNELDLRELYWINHYKSNDPNYGYNIRIDCTTNRGRKHSNESKNKMSKERKGKPAWNKGLKMSDDHCKAVSLRQKGKKTIPCSDKKKKAISDAMKANWSNKDFKEKRVVQIQEGFKKIIKVPEIFCIDCSKQLSDKYSKTKRCFACNVKNKKKNAKKYFCIDCNALIKKGIERCKSCHTNHCSIRMKNWQANKKLKLLASFKKLVA